MLDHDLIRILRDRCIGSGNCEFRAPHTFRVGDDGVAVVLQPIGDPIDAVLVAARECPVQAIEVHSDQAD